MDMVSTAEVSAGERFAFWREVSTKLWVPYDLRCDPRVESDFRAQVGISDFGPVQATLLTTMPHSVHRSAKLIRQTEPFCRPCHTALLQEGIQHRHEIQVQLHGAHFMAVRHAPGGMSRRRCGCSCTLDEALSDEALAVEAFNVEALTPEALISVR